MFVKGPGVTTPTSIGDGEVQNSLMHNCIVLGKADLSGFMQGVKCRNRNRAFLVTERGNVLCFENRTT